MSIRLKTQDYKSTDTIINIFMSDPDVSHLWPFISSILPEIDNDSGSLIIFIGVNDSSMIDKFPYEIQYIDDHGIIGHIEIKTYYD
jgi:hypothetical protein